MYRIDSKEGKRRTQVQNVFKEKEIERQNYKMSNLAAALYLAYPGLLFLLNIFMTSSPWLSMKWKPQLKQKKNICMSHSAPWHWGILYLNTGQFKMQISMLRILAWALSEEQEGRSRAKCHLTGLPAFCCTAQLG